MKHKKLFIILGIASGLLLAVLACLTLVGMTIPKNHSVSLSENLPTDIDKLWHLISSFEDQPSWNKAIEKVERSQRFGESIVKEYYTNGATISYKVTIDQPSYRIVREIIDEQAPFKGSWIYQLEAISSEETKLNLLERGTIENPLLRFLSHRVMGLDAFQ